MKELDVSDALNALKGRYITFQGSKTETTMEVTLALREALPRGSLDALPREELCCMFLSRL